MMRMQAAATSFKASRACWSSSVAAISVEGVEAFLPASGTPPARIPIPTSCSSTRGS